jgi:hypothetical protein
MSPNQDQCYSSSSLVRGFLFIMVMAFVAVEWMSLRSVSEVLEPIEWSAVSIPRLTVASAVSKIIPLTAAATATPVVNSSSCFPHNSRAWLEGERLGNANDESLSIEEEDFLYHQILSSPGEIFAHASTQTICHPDSTFRNPKWSVANEKLIDEWELRLLFLALHHHQHAPARREAQARKACGPLMKNAQSVRMDYECPSAKLLVVNLEPIGMGASFRLGAIGSLLLGVATDRVTLFVNNVTGIMTTSPSERSATTEDQDDATPDTVEFIPWALASCARGDYQCVYQAMSPCTVLLDDLQGLHSANETSFMHEGHAQDLRRKGKYKKPEYETARILVMKARVLPFNKWAILDKIQAKLYDIAMSLIDDMREKASLEQIAVFEAAASRIANGTSKDMNNEDNTTNDEYSYSSRYTKTSHAALLYILRPNRHYQQLSDAIVDNLVPKQVDKSLAIGLPIRGSDKCRVESVCYGFDTYMKLMKRMWEDNLDSPAGKQATIILTTEDESIVNSRQAYELNESFPFRFIVNTYDTFQGSGHPANYKEQADDVMLSSIVSLKLQLRTKYVVGNCCSNFHLMLFDLVHSGCGALPDVKPQCLQEHPDPEFSICCEWTHSEVCDARRSEQKEERVRNWERKAAENKRLKEEDKKNFQLTDEGKLAIAERKRLQKMQRKERRNPAQLNGV